ncbi:MAG: hypothetical protein WDM79_12050 [Terricaulis sp.]
MSSGSWVVRGVDPSAREEAREAAARQGVSLAEYLTEALQRKRDERAGLIPDVDSGSERPSNAVRTRIESMERRVQTAAASFDDALGSIDRAMFDLAERFDGAEAATQETAQALAEAREHFTLVAEAITERLAQVESGAEAVTEGFETTRQAVADSQEKLLAEIEAVSQRASDALTQSRDAIIAEVSRDLSAFDSETRHLIETGLAQARDAATTAAQEAQAAASAAMGDVWALREAIEQRLLRAHAEANERLEGALMEAAVLNAEITERVDLGERRNARAHDELAASVAESESNLRADLLEAVVSLRETDAAIAQTTDTIVDDARIARLEFTAACVELKRAMDHLAEDGRGAAGVLRDAFTAADEALASHIEALAASSAAATEELRQTFSAADAALTLQIESLAASSAEANDAVRHDFTSALEELRNGQLGANARLRLLDEAIGTDQNGVSLMARLGQIEAELMGATRIGFSLGARIGQIESDLADTSAHEAVEARITRIEKTLEQSDMEDAIARLGASLHELAERPVDKLDPSLLARFDGLGERISLQETFAAQAAQARQDMEAGLDRVSARVADAIHAIEHKLGALQDAQRATADQNALTSLEAALDQRIQALSRAVPDLAGVEGALAETERRQAEVVAGIANDVSRLSDMVDARLRNVEQFCETTSGKTASRSDLAKVVSILEDRLSSLERRDDVSSERIGVELTAMRQRIDERFSQIEQRSVRAIERLSETVALIGAKLNQRQENMVLELVDRVSATPQR